MFSLLGIPQESRLGREHLVTVVKIKFKEKSVPVSCNQCILFAGIFLTQATPDQNRKLPVTNKTGFCIEMSHVFKEGSRVLRHYRNNKSSTKFKAEDICSAYYC